MVWKCFVPNCNSGFKNGDLKVSMFKAPKDPAVLAAWRRAIPRADRVLSSRDRVCAHHFPPHLIVTKATVDKVDEMISGKINRIRPRLLKGATPTLFPSTVVSTRKKLKVDHVAPDPSYYGVDIPTRVNEEIEETLSPVGDAFTFNMLWAAVQDIKLPNSSWNVHKIDKIYRSRHIAFVDVRTSNKGMKITKQIVFDNTGEKGANCTYKVYVLGLPVERSEIAHLVCPKSAQDVENIIAFLHSTPFCRGGPWRCVAPVDAYIDENDKWRHKRCTLLCDPGRTQCQWCCLLKDADGQMTLQKSKPKNTAIKKQGALQQIL